MSHRINTFTLFATGLSFLVIAAVAVLGLRSIVRKSLPRDGSVVEVRGIKTEVQVAWDDTGVPHITAESDEDLYFGLGYAQAMDRLWQMDFLRRTAQGRLAEVLGQDAVRSDKCMRTMGFSRLADSLYASCSGETRVILEAYSAGVNAGIEAMQGRMPIEFDLLQYRPEAWTPRHCLLVQRLQAWRMSPALTGDLLALDLRRVLGRQRARQAMTADPSTTSIPDSVFRSEPHTWLPSLPVLQPFIGSRDMGGIGWTLDGARSTSGAPILALDLHSEPEIPSRWYLVHLSAPGISAVGAVLPGVPALIHGRSEVLCWGSIPAGLDDVDLVRETVHLADSVVIDQGGPTRLRMFTDSILVKNGHPVVLTVAETRHGPLLLPGLEDAGRADLRPGDGFYSIAWTGRQPSDEISAYHRLLRTSTASGIGSALGTYGCPTVRILLATRTGSPVAITAGILALRSVDAALFPVDGTQPGSDWTLLPTGIHGSPDAASAYSTGSGDPAVMAPLSPLWSTLEQRTRLHALISAEARLSRQDMHLFFYDETATASDTLRDACVHALLTMPGRPIELTRIMNLLSHWDLRMSVFSPIAAVFDAIVRHTLYETFHDDMGTELARRYLDRPYPARSLLVRALGDSTAAWWLDNQRTPGIETRENILRKATVAAVRELQQAQGLNSRTWMLGAARSVTFRHPLWDRRRGLGLLNIGPLSLGGGVDVLNFSMTSSTSPTEVSTCSVLRMVCDMSRPSLDIMLPTGTSGQSFSPHYADQTVLWQSSALPSYPLHGTSREDVVHTLRPR